MFLENCEEEKELGKKEEKEWEATRIIKWGEL